MTDHKPKKPINPFYLLLLMAGCAFAITACAYGVMTVRQLHNSRAGYYLPKDLNDSSTSPSAGSEQFNDLVDRLGPTVMIVELVLLTIGTFGAIAYDQHLDGKPSASNEQISTHKREST